MKLAIFEAEGGGRPGKGQVVGKHSRTEDEPDGSKDAWPSACDEEFHVARVIRLWGTK